MNLAPHQRLRAELDSLPWVFDTADAASLDEDFADLLALATKYLHEPTVIETSAGNFPVATPRALHAAPMWVLWLPDELAGDVAAFAEQAPSIWELSSVDLMKRRATFEWKTSTHRLCVNILNVTQSLAWAHENASSIVVAFMTPSRTAIAELPVDEDLMLDAFLRGTRCDYNYRPLREFSEEELDEAATRSVLCGNEPRVDEDGLTIVHPLGVRYRYDQPR